MTGQELHRRLSEPFAVADVEWRVTKLRNQNSEGLVVPFIDSRAIQNRLDDVVGPFFWRTRFIPWHQYVPKPGKYEDPNEVQKTPVSSQLCGLSIYDAERKEWVEKVDGAENTDIEAIKGGISDSFKRAAVIWGVGRYLYEIPARWTSLDKYKQIARPAELNSYYMEQLQKLGLCAAQDPNAGGAPSGVYAVRSLQPAPVQGYPAAAWVDLVTPAGRALKVFSLGTKPGLASGVRIQGAKIVQRSSAGGTYYELQDYLPAA